MAILQHHEGKSASKPDPTGSGRSCPVRLGPPILRHNRAGGRKGRSFAPRPPERPATASQAGTLRPDALFSGRRARRKLDMPAADSLSMSRILRMATCLAPGRKEAKSCRFANHHRRPSPLLNNRDRPERVVAIGIAGRDHPVRARRFLIMPIARSSSASRTTSLAAVGTDKSTAKPHRRIGKRGAKTKPMIAAGPQ